MKEFATRYPIYRFKMLLSDRDHNVSTSKMCKAHLTFSQGNQALQEFVEANLDSGRQGKDGAYTIRSLELEVVGAGWKFVREETWCCGWFQHYTYDVDLTDAELLESFEQYVRRHEADQMRLDESVQEHRERAPDYVCLMGAEDRWRWKKGVCRCEHCQKRGVVTIDH